MAPIAYKAERRTAFQQGYRYETAADSTHEVATTAGGKVRIARCQGGSVKKARTARGQLAAIKGFKGTHALAAGEREAAILRQLNSPYIVGVQDVFAGIKTRHGLTYKKLQIALEYLPRTLSDARLDGASFNEEQVRSIVRCLVAGIAQCHRQGIVHDDLLSCNIGLTPEGAKLIDFGNARLIKEGGDPSNDIRRILAICSDLLESVDEISAPAQRFLDLAKQADVSLRTLSWHSWLRCGSATDGWVAKINVWADWLMEGRSAQESAEDSIV